MANDGSPIPAIVLGLALTLTAIAGVLMVDSLITGHALRQSARRLRDMPDPPAHTAN